MNDIIEQILDFAAQPTVFGPIVYALALCFLLRITKDVYVKFKRRKSGFGTIFDSITGKPIDLARVRLVDVHGLTVTSAVTDKYGHYRIVAAPGEYTVDISKPGYTFPSVFLKEHERSKMYHSVLPSRRIKVKDHGIITKNIPVDPVEGMKKRSKVFSALIVLSENTQLTIAYVSPLLAVIYPYLRETSIASWSIFTIYLIVLIYRITHFTPGKPAYGTITDAKTGNPLDRVVIRLFDSKFNKLMSTQVTSPKGRYAFLVNRGGYYMTLQKESYKKIRLNYPNITKDSYPLATNVKMKRIDK